MKPGTVAVVAAIVVVVFVVGFFVGQQAATTSTVSLTTSTSSTTSQSESTQSTSTSWTSYSSTSGSGGSTSGLQVQLSVSLYRAAGTSGTVMVSMAVDEYNTLATQNNVSASSSWALPGLSDGPCGTMGMPYGVALYSGAYTAANISTAQRLDIFPVVPCPMYIRLITGYLFQPTSDMALILPGTGNATAMMSVVNATGTYSGGLVMSPTPFPPGTYTAVAGDEWGGLVFQQFTISAGAGTPSNNGVATATVTTAVTTLASQPTTTYAQPTNDCTIMPVTMTTTTTVTVGPTPPVSTTTTTVTTTSTSYTQTVTVTSCTYSEPTVTSTITTSVNP